MDQAFVRLFCDDEGETIHSLKKFHRLAEKLCGSQLRATILEVRLLSCEGVLEPSEVGVLNPFEIFAEMHRAGKLLETMLDADEPSESFAMQRCELYWSAIARGERCNSPKVEVNTPLRRDPKQRTFLDSGPYDGLLWISIRHRLSKDPTS